MGSVTACLRSLLIVALLTVLACGGGGGSNDTNSPPHDAASDALDGSIGVDEHDQLPDQTVENDAADTHTGDLRQDESTDQVTDLRPDSDLDAVVDVRVDSTDSLWDLGPADSEDLTPLDLAHDQDDGPAPGSLGYKCKFDSDCSTTAGCRLGVCSNWCRQGQTAIAEACTSAATPMACPSDVDFCVAGIAQNDKVICYSNHDCSDSSDAVLVCAAVFAGDGGAAHGICIPAGTRQPAGASCGGASGADGCQSLLCLGEPAVCSSWCSQASDCPAGSVCTWHPVDDTGALSYATLCVPMDGSLKPCAANADCVAGLEYCAALVGPDNSVLRVCTLADAPGGGLAGEPCSSTNPCYDGWCLFSQWEAKAAPYCSTPCVSDSDCPTNTRCRDLPFAPDLGPHPAGQFTMAACVAVEQGDTCFVGHDSMCQYTWSSCDSVAGTPPALGKCNDGQCAPDCEGKACGAQDGCGGICTEACLALAAPCATSNQCLSGFCVDGVCCATACTGTCQTCSLPNAVGFCKSIPAGQDPQKECGVCHLCNGQGGCAVFGVGQDPDDGCGLCSMCSEAGDCVPMPTGQDPYAECPACTVCDGSGQCAPVPGGADPKSDCAPDDVATCGQTGVCDGGGACALFPDGAECAAQRCAGGLEYAPSLCNGLGSCVEPSGAACGPLVCDAAGWACLDTCSDTIDCLSGNFCHAGECKPLPSCPLETKLICNAAVPSTTSGQANHYSDYPSCFPGPQYKAPDRIYYLKLDADSVVTVTVDNLSFDAALALMKDACSPGEACTAFADSGVSAAGETITFTARKSVQYHLAVDGATLTDYGAYNITTQCCTIQCAQTNACGDDGCGGSCGTCPAGDVCYQGTCNACADDPSVEPNNVCAAAVPTVGGVQAGLLCPVGDEDWLSVTVTEGTTLKAVVNGDDESLRVDLFGLQCGGLVQAGETAPQGNVVDWLAIHPGTYFLRVTAPAATEVLGYNLSVTTTAPECTKDSQCTGGKVCGLFKCVYPPQVCGIEENLTCGAIYGGDTTGQPMAFSDYSRCTDTPMPGSEEMHRLTVTEPTVVTLTTNNAWFTDGLAVLEGHCAPSWACLAASQDSGSLGPQQVKFKAQPGKYYYVLVDGVSPESEGSYSLSVDCCVPTCGGRECGTDGCGMDCGQCPGAQDACVDGQCVCVPRCDGIECGDDGCGGSCADCPSVQDQCLNHVCECIPDCAGRVCGDDGCGGSCGPDCPLGTGCLDGQCFCVPSCAGRECGDDGCGGTCGACKEDNRFCVEHQCVCMPSCAGKECGPDGCGGLCGTCEGPQDACMSGVCTCVPTCENRECGDDGCDGSCGTCLAGQSCENHVCGCSSDGSTEPNGNCAQAPLVEPGTWDNLGICPEGDNDFVAIHLAAGEILTAEITFNNEHADLDMMLYSEASCTEHLTASSGATDQETIVFTAVDSGIYYVKVKSYANQGTAAYTLSLTVN